ncbi:ribosomal biogenesis regulatory protein [Xylariaceae sp. FL0804]|nr:ribosomal biogenesis regulatory protein [Xylariaceae sp. FL0804]
MAALPKARAKLDVAVAKPTPYTFDLGLLLANDPNPITSSTPAESDSTTTATASGIGGASALEAQLVATARDGAQSLINQLLTACPLSTTPSGVLLSLPAPSTPLPREKPLPAPPQPTKWQQFAARKGIRPRTREQRAARSLRFVEGRAGGDDVDGKAGGRWEKTWGHDRDGRLSRRAEGRVQDDWLVEVKAGDDLDGGIGGGNKKRSGGGGGGGSGGGSRSASAKGKKRRKT